MAPVLHWLSAAETAATRAVKATKKVERENIFVKDGR
jgi:hypothetical protein